MSICLKTKEEVQSWLDKNEIKNYIINDNLIVDVKDTVYLINKNYSEYQLPIQFGKVDKDFICNWRFLSSLKGMPEYVGGDLDLQNNNISSLKGSPKEVKGNFNVSGNPLINLQHPPKSVGTFICDHTKKENLYNLIPEYIEMNISHKFIHKAKTSADQIKEFIKYYKNDLLEIDGIIFENVMKETRNKIKNELAERRRQYLIHKSKTEIPTKEIETTTQIRFGK